MRTNSSGMPNTEIAIDEKIVVIILAMHRGLNSVLGMAVASLR